MLIKKTILTKSQVELKIELSINEFKPYIEKSAEIISKKMQIKGFRPGKIPYDILKQKIGEMTILEKAVSIAIDSTIETAIRKNIDGHVIDQPRVDIIKLAPNNPMEYKVVISVLPKINVCDYKNIKVEKQKIEVSDKDVSQAIEKLCEMRVKETLTDREIKNTDKVVVDIEMFLDNVLIEGGQSKNVVIIIGKDYFVPGFSNKLIKAKKGDVKNFDLPYPKDYYQSNLAGKLVNFKVKIIEIYERKIPDINDDFAITLNFKNLEDLQQNIKQNIKIEKSLEAEQKMEMEILNKILEKTKFDDIPEILVSDEVQGMLVNLEQSVITQGGKFDDYLASMHKTRNQLTLDLLPEAVKRVKASLIIREITMLENIKTSEKEIDNEIQYMIGKYNALKMHEYSKKLQKQSKELKYKAHIHNVLTNRKVFQKLKEYNALTT